MTLSKETAYNIQVPAAGAVKHAWDMIARDHENVFGSKPLRKEPGTITIRYAASDEECPAWPEAYSFQFSGEGDSRRLEIIGRDELGLIYGMLHYSRACLGVDPFWFWADLPPARRESVTITAESFHSAKPKVRYRGWFVNDEVCLIGWKEEYPPTREVWLPVFEALLRCGGNMVIPGTDLPKHGVHHELAAEMGLWITHHHAEPLGAEMFLRAYPGKQPSYLQHPGLFENLWREAIEKQQENKIVWVLSFRGQGDKPFWEDDPSFDTPEKRGAMIASVIKRQYEMVRETVAEPVCCMAMYGEIAELYKAGHIQVPAGIIKVWADNGYGKMVSRRHGSLNERIPALPSADDSGKHGLYYHVTFHDLQASNHLTLFPSSPELITGELAAAFQAGADEYLLLNCGNIRQHLYTLDLVSRCWQDGPPAGQDEEGLSRFAGRLFTRELEDITSLYRRYFASTIAYGPHPDDRAGEEFYHHPARQIIGRWISRGGDEPEPSLVWAAGRQPFPAQVAWFGRKAADALPSWEQLAEDCRTIMGRLQQEESRRLHDHLLFHIELHASGCRGLAALSRAYQACWTGHYPLAFVHASQSMRDYAEGLHVLQTAEHGRWRHFYRADWLTNIANTVEHADTLRRYLRMHGDSPDMFLWYKAYLMPETEKYIYLENTHRRPLSDDELARRLRDYFLDSGELQAGS
ncbi:glycosyl hydrolase 115 family protein [Paenibacillus sambharensis]|nr:glycosyl hydrolase 115 family protein [Paenibacillus sambharensis]